MDVKSVLKLFDRNKAFKEYDNEVKKAMFRIGEIVVDSTVAEFGMWRGGVNGALVGKIELDEPAPNGLLTFEMNVDQKKAKIKKLERVFKKFGLTLGVDAHDSLLQVYLSTKYDSTFIAFFEYKVTLNRGCPVIQNRIKFNQYTRKIGNTISIPSAQTLWSKMSSLKRVGCDVLDIFGLQCLDLVIDSCSEADDFRYEIDRRSGYFYFTFYDSDERLNEWKTYIKECSTWIKKLAKVYKEDIKVPWLNSSAGKVEPWLKGISRGAEPWLGFEAHETDDDGIRLRVYIDILNNEDGSHTVRLHISW